MADLNIDCLPFATQIDTERHLGNRRKQPRHKVQDAIKIQLSVPPVEGTFAGELLDVTSRGVSIQTQDALRRGTIVSVKCDTQRVYGKVAYCRGAAQGYVIGVEINEAVQDLD